MVGAGAAGCVVARRLVDRSDEVILIEAGDRHDASNRSAGDRGAFLSDTARFTALDVVPADGQQPSQYLLGRGLGGSSLINGGLVTGGVDPSLSPLPLEPPWAIGPVGSAMLSAGVGAAVTQLVRRAGERVTAIEALLGPVVDAENLHVRTGSPVRRLTIAGRRIVGVELETGEALEADRVVLCTGAIGTPVLLLRSGIDTPQIGVGLQDHVGRSLGFDLRAGVLDPSAPSISVSAERDGRQLLAVDHVPGVSDMAGLIAGWLRITSRGRVTLDDPDGPPEIRFNQLSTPADLDGLAGAVEQMFALAEHDAFRRIVAEIYLDEHGTTLDQIRGDAERTRAWLSGGPSAYHHAASSCRLGVVTDALARVRGYDGLAVCDASLFAAVPEFNPYLEVVRLAERVVGRWVSGDWL